MYVSFFLTSLSPSPSCDIGKWPWVSLGLTSRDQDRLLWRNGSSVAAYGRPLFSVGGRWRQLLAHQRSDGEWVWQMTVARHWCPFVNDGCYRRHWLDVEDFREEKEGRGFELWSGCSQASFTLAVSSLLMVAAEISLGDISLLSSIVVWHWLEKPSWLGGWHGVDGGLMMKL